MWPTLLQTISVFVAAAAVVIGVSSWRRSLIGQRKVDIAERALDHFVQARDAIRMIRNPVGYVGEGVTRQQEEGETEEVKLLRDRSYVAIERYNKKSILFAELAALKYRFSLYFGEEYEVHFNTIEDVRNEIFNASMILREVWLRQGRVDMSKDEFAEHLDRMHKAEAVFWEGYDESDPISSRVDDALRQIDQACRTAISPPSNFWTHLKSARNWLVQYFKC